MKTAIVYDRVNKWGGAERVLLALHEIFPDASLYTSVYSPDSAPWANVFPEVIPTFLQNIPILNKNHELLGAFSPIGYEQFNFDKFDLVISVTSEAAKGIITKPKTLHICYCLTPTRYLWSGYQDYLDNPPKSLNWIPFYKLVSQPFLRYSKYWDKVAAQRPDEYIAISSTVKDRIKNYYHRDSEIIYPPVDLDKFKTQNSKFKNTDQKLKVKDYYLIVSRLVPYKKVDLALEVFGKLGLPLIIIGTGSEEGRYKAKYKFKKNIIFKGLVSDRDLVNYYQNAKVLFHPQDEDFGLTTIEAQAVGVPVIAYKKGGALDTVIEGKTGLFFTEQSTKSLIDVIKRFEKKKFLKSDLIRNAERFSKERFEKEFVDFINSKV